MNTFSITLENVASQILPLGMYDIKYVLLNPKFVLPFV